MKSQYIKWFLILSLWPTVLPGATDENTRLGNAAFSKGDFAQAVQYYENAVAEAKEVTPQLLRLLAQAQYMTNQFADALDNFEKAYATAPDANDMLWMGQCYAQTGQWSRGENVLLRYLGGKPQNSEALGLLAYIFSHADKTDEAIAVYKNLIRKYPGQTRYLMQMANVQTAAGYYDQAVETLEFARYISPQETAEVNRLLADLYTDRKMFREAAACYQRITLSSDSPAVEDYYRLGYAYYNIGEFLSASEVFEKIRQIEPAQSKAVLYLGHIAREKGDTQAARQYYLDTIKTGQQQAEAYVALAELELNEKNYGKAAEYFSAAIKAGASSPEVYYNYALTFILDEKLADAKNVIREALKTHPGNEQLNDLLDLLIKKTVEN